MKPPSEFAQNKRQEDVRPSLRVSDWYSSEGGDQVARRSQVWGLIGWYHRKVVEPQLGFRGMVRRLYWRIRSHTSLSVEARMKFRRKLISPWEQLEIVAAIEEQERLKALD